MNGFDNYIPSKWLDGIMAVHVAAPVSFKPKNAPFRRGRWITQGIVAAALTVGTVCSTISTIKPTAVTGRLTPIAVGGNQYQKSEYAPPGYFEKLALAIKATARLPAQSISSDPPVLV